MVTAATIYADCEQECQKSYDACKAEVQKSGGYSFFKCLEEREKCRRGCPAK